MDTVKKRITLGDIARLAGVSKTTVSMILNGQSEQFRISADTRKKVEEIARLNGYRANANARALQAQRNNVIGLVIPDLTNYGFASTAKNLEKLCRNNGLQLVITCSDDNPQQEKQAIERLLDRQIDVLVTAPTHLDPSYYQSIRRHTPIIQIDRMIPQENMDFIVTDDEPKVADLVEKMVQSYRLDELFYLSGQLSLSPSLSRLNGFRGGLRRANLIEQQGWVRFGDYQPQSGYEMFKALCEQLGRLPKAVFTASYTLLEGVLRYLSEHKLTNKLLNGELYLATFDDHELLNALPFHIHSIRQNHQLIAERTFEHISQKLNSIACGGEKLDCDIIWRDS